MVCISVYKWDFMGEDRHLYDCRPSNREHGRNAMARSTKMLSYICKWYLLFGKGNTLSTLTNNAVYGNALGDFSQIRSAILHHF